jgi:ABC-type cobalamin/Fe3+-siderophores transport system ATPase subunit
VEIGLQAPTEVNGAVAVRPGELVAIVGGSGAGKTTLLEALAGVRPADDGEVWFDGVEFYRSLDALRTRLGYVPQADIIHAELLSSGRCGTQRGCGKPPKPPAYRQGSPSAKGRSRDCLTRQYP